jgi:hypothetical protein
VIDGLLRKEPADRPRSADVWYQLRRVAAGASDAAGEPPPAGDTARPRPAGSGERPGDHDVEDARAADPSDRNGEDGPAAAPPVAAPPAAATPGPAAPPTLHRRRWRRSGS